MASKSIGEIRKGIKVWEVTWNPGTKSVYVRLRGGGLFGNPTLSAGKANSAGDAMLRAEAFVYNK